MRKPLKINFLEGDVEQQARRSTMLVAGVFTLLVGILSTIGAGASYHAATTGVSVFSEVGNFFSLAELRRLVWNTPSDTNNLFATPDGRLNLLFLGVGGEGHDGKDLTDTILFVSIDRAQKKIGSVSIPRDLAYPLGGGKFEKINSVNAYEELRAPGQGAKKTAEALAQLFETRIDRVIKLNFKGFITFIDALGGIDIDVKNSFTDTQFPTDDDGPNPYKWTSVNFTKGVEHMNGKRALTYARSRHASGGEGSDFARSRRQQQLFHATRERLLSLGTLTNPRKLMEIWTAVSNNVQTDLSVWEFLKLAPIAGTFQNVAVTSQVLTDDPNGELINGSVNGSFLLFPRRSDWSEIRALLANPFESKRQLVEEQRAKKVTLEIKNGTSRIGAAALVAATLERSGYEVLATGNARRRNYERTIIYDLTNGIRTDELAKLRTSLHAEVVTIAPFKEIILPDGSRELLAAPSAQFLVILGNVNLATPIEPYAAPTP